ncbi:hypothetical protein [Saccharopolyspora tripterygii]
MNTHTNDELDALWASTPWSNDIPMPTRDHYGWIIKFPDGSYFRINNDGGRKRAVLTETDDFAVTPNAKPDARMPGARMIEQLRP